jgi:hypothetical protein
MKKRNEEEENNEKNRRKEKYHLKGAVDSRNNSMLQTSASRKNSAMLQTSDYQLKALKSKGNSRRSSTRSSIDKSKPGKYMYILFM